METADYRRLLVEAGAIVEGHFVYASGRHGPAYVNKTAGLVYASHAAQHAARIAAWCQYRQNALKRAPIKAVVGPELGAVAFMADVRHQLWKATGEDIAGVIAEKVRSVVSGEFAIGRDQARFIKDKDVLVVEDILTTGQSAAKAVRAVREAGGNPVMAACLWNRGGVTAGDIGVRELFSVIEERITDYAEAACPLCKEGVPVDTGLGKGAEFLKKKAQAAA
jgi:orotate phosphoribosyltransferase